MWNQGDDKMLDCEEMDFLRKSLPFFQMLDSDEQGLISATAFSSVCPSGQIILSKGRECKGLLIVKRGQLRVLYGLKDGKQITLHRLLRGDACILTASCVLKNISFEIILEVEKECEAVFIPPTTWRSLTKNPGVKEFSMALISERPQKSFGYGPDDIKRWSSESPLSS